MNLPRSLALAASASLAFAALALPGRAAAADPSAESIVARARAIVGSESALVGLTTIKYSGQMFDGNGTMVGTIMMEFKKPGAQRSEFITANGTEIEATDGYEGWALRIDNSGRKGMAIIMPPQLANYINTSYENLYFFRGPQQRRGGTIELAGAGDLNGHKCWKVTFNYPSGLIFTRFFDQATGELRGTMTDDGHTEIVESGKTLAGGINFPSRIDSFSDGKLVRTMKFDKITVNESLDDALFTVPSVSVLAAPPGTQAVVPTAPVASGVAGFTAPPPANTPPPPSATPPASGSSDKINVPPATPQAGEQPLMFNIKPSSGSN
jgi:hypothetical protein